MRIYSPEADKNMNHINIAKSFKKYIIYNKNHM